MIYAIAGSGGKTGLIHEMADRYRSEGKKVFVTTSTHMMIEDDMLLEDDAELITERLLSTGYVMAGLPSENESKFGPLSYSTYDKVCQAADVVFVEADGSRHMPLKFPYPHEPVIYPNTNEIIIVTGLYAAGLRLCEVTYNAETAASCLACEDTSIITPEMIQTLLRRGYLDMLSEAYPEMKISVHAALSPKEGTSAGAAASEPALYIRALKALIERDIDVSIIRKEWFDPMPRLFICGAGHVAEELAQMAGILEFGITVMDDRAEYADASRLPTADRVICDTFDNLSSYLEPGAFYVVVTRGHADDYSCVKQIITSKYSYLGMIGSRMKVARTMEMLEADLKAYGLDPKVLDDVHAPIGLSIGAQTPAEIAVSILAEIIKVKNLTPTSSASKELLESDETGVLCIITGKTGSSPRGVGSMMLVSDNKVIDTIGGGSIEACVIEDARSTKDVTEREYNLGDEEVKRLGMICGGSNKVLFIPIS